jgi:hypothetical protein
LPRGLGTLLTHDGSAGTGARRAFQAPTHMDAPLCKKLERER